MKYFKEEETLRIISPLECRQIIKEIPNNRDLETFISHMQIYEERNFDILDCQKFYETIYLLALRTGEACGVKSSADTNKNTGMTLKAEKAWYTPDPTINEEMDNLTRLIYTRRLREGITTPPSLNDILKIHEPITFFSVQVEKRKDMFIRRTAIPVRFDPLAMPVSNYIMAHQDNPPIFPINRQQALRLAHIIFKGYSYKIKSYRINKQDSEGNIILKENGKPEKEIIPNKTKPCGDHATRHLRIEEAKKLGIRGPYLKTFVGWTPEKDDALEDIYSSETFRAYLPFLLMQKFN